MTPEQIAEASLLVAQSALWASWANVIAQVVLLAVIAAATWFAPSLAIKAADELQRRKDLRREKWVGLRAVADAAIEAEAARDFHAGVCHSYNFASSDVSQDSPRRLKMAESESGMRAAELRLELSVQSLEMVYGEKHDDIAGLKVQMERILFPTVDQPGGKPSLLIGIVTDIARRSGLMDISKP